jgi:hypothetical protein
MISPSLTQKNKRQPPEPPPAQNVYRCPACGEMVDNRDRAAVRFHHDHVLHPRFDRFVTLPSGVGFSPTSRSVNAPTAGGTASSVFRKK